MWPWGHLAVGYLTYVLVLRIRGNERQTLATLSAVAFGTLFPDLVDKPLAWTFNVLPSGRSLTHSLLVASLIIAVVYWLALRWDRREPALAFAVGYVSHSLSDLGPEVVWRVLQGDWRQLEWTTYLLWPLLPAPPYPHDDSFAQHLANLVLDPYMAFQLGLLGVAVVVWYQSGMPGLANRGRESSTVAENR